MNKLKQFIKAHNELIDEFTDKYYPESYCEMWYAWDSERWFLNPIQIWDEYWSLDDIYMAMYYNIDKDIVWKWFDYDFDQYQQLESWEIEHRINFYNFIKKEQWKK